MLVAITFVIYGNASALLEYAILLSNKRGTRIFLIYSAQGNIGKSYTVTCLNRIWKAHVLITTYGINISML